MFLKEGLEKIGIPFTDEDLEKLNLYVQEISIWNGTYGLVKAKGRDLLVKHIFDSLTPLPLLLEMSYTTLADAGSGAGLPGIPLAIFLKDKKITLIERSAKRAGFLQNAVSLLGLSNNVSILECPVEDVRELFDVVTFRAFRKLDSYFISLKNLLNKGGLLFAYKGKLDVILAEVKLLESAPNYEIMKIEVPYLHEERHIVKLW